MLTVWLSVIVVVVCLVCFLLRRTTNYWSSRGLPQLEPLPLFGNYLPVLTLSKNCFDIYQQAYKEFPDAGMVGLYEFTNPTLLVKEPELIEQVLIRDFNSYPDHGPFIFEKSSLIHDGLFMMQGERWRALRNKLLSTFTTSRMREMFPGIVSCCEELVASNPQSLDRESFSRFAVDTFLRGLLGVNMNPRGEAELRDNIKAIFEAPLSRYVQQQLLIYYPRLGEFLNFKYIPSWMNKYFRSLVNTILNTREQSGLRKDFADVLLQIRNKTMNVFDRENNKTKKVFECTNELVICQGFMFFFAGMDTTSLVMLYTAFELARSPQAQDKARQEVRTLWKKHGALTYEAVREMKYIEQCIQESLRLHPSLVFLMRITDKATTLGGVPLEKNTRIIIPNYCLQTDPKYFPNPEHFDPDRFHENSSRNKFAHLPFSDGPRVCVGKKFSLIEISTLFAHLLLKYELSLDEETKLPLEYQQRTVFLTPQNPVKIKLSKLDE